MSVIVVGLNHRTAPVEIRECVAVQPHMLKSVLLKFYQIPGIAECVLLSTCNRLEVYLVTESSEYGYEAVIKLMSELSDLDIDLLKPYIFVHQNGDAVRHLFGVASGLDSMVMGESQIAGQVKDAVAAAMQAGTSRVVLNRLFRCAIEASKRGRTETEIASGAVSVSFASVELAKKIFGSLKDRSAVVLGAGKMSELTARHLVENGIRSLIVASRTVDRAKVLAKKVNGRAVTWKEAIENLNGCDVVISSTSADGYILDKNIVSKAMQQRKNRSMFLIDIAVPRDIEPEVGEIYNVVLYDIDDLQAVVEANLERRKLEAEKVWRVIEEEVLGFLSWLNSLDVVPAIMALRERFQEVMETELGVRKLSGFSDGQKKLVLDLLRRYMNKLLHGPVTRLKEFSDTDEGLAHVASLSQLFGLKLDRLKETNSLLEKDKKTHKRLRS